MITPRIEIDLGAIEHNTRELVTRLRHRGIAVTGSTKATLGSPDVAKAMIRGGVTRLGDSRLENLEALRESGIRVPLMLLRAPAPAWADRVVATAQTSLVSDLDIVTALSVAAGKRAVTHEIILMVELGDLREGVMTADALDAARMISRTRHLVLAGVETNLACRSGVVPGDDQMQQLGAIASTIGSKFGVPAPIISGGNSANLIWALGSGRVGAVNDVRLGESILLGVDPLTRNPIPGLRTDAFTVVAPVIESLVKPSAPWGGCGHRVRSACQRNRATAAASSRPSWRSVARMWIPMASLHPWASVCSAPAATIWCWSHPHEYLRELKCALASTTQLCCAR